MSDTVSEMNDRFGLPGKLTFVEGAGGMMCAHIDNGLAHAEISLHGGQVLRFQPQGQQPVLWLSPDSEYADQRAIRGGIPVCWPWFGPHSTSPAFPKHGFARLNNWQVLGTETLPGGETRVRLSLAQDNAIRGWWPHAFELTIAITVGQQLDVRLTARNPGPVPWRMTAALHSYFEVCDVEAISIEGLEGKIYLDQPAGGIPRLQAEDVTLRGEVDRVYLDTAATCHIVDLRYGRRISVEKLGSRSTVVWNPGAEQVRKIGDFSDREWRRVVCLETANAASDSIEIPPGGEHVLGTRIGVELL